MDIAKVIVYNPAMTEECCAAAMCAFMEEIPTLAVVATADLGSILIEKQLTSSVIVLGSYWMKSLDLHPDIDCDVYANETSLESTHRVHIDYKNPIDFVKGVVLKNVLDKPRNKGFLKQHQDTLQITVDRFEGKTINSAFFTGLYQLNSFSYDSYMMIFLNETTFKECLKNGTQILESQIKMAHARAVKNSTIVETVINGELIKIVVTDAPDLCNLTHAELIKQYPDVHITMTTYLMYENQQASIKTSFRSPVGIDVSIAAKL
jgi:hypothetical protein